MSMRGAVYEALRDELMAARDRVLAEIAGYPTPIPRCDAQFNYLIEKRNEIQEELERLEALKDTGSFEEIEAFLRSSSSIGEDVRRKLLSTMNKGVTH